MVRKRMFLSLAMVVALVGMIGVASAAQNVANVSQKGSLLVFPDIFTEEGGGQVWDTIVTIGNDGGSAVTVKCYWMDLDQNTWDFEVTLTPNQPVWFSAKTGKGSIVVDPFGETQGELKCWAIDITTDPESVKQYNHLYGSALQIDPPNVSALEYNAWAFTLRGTPANPSGPLTLNGTTDYDACPAYLTYNFFAEGGNATQGTHILPSYLALSPCQQDLRQERGPICAKAKFDVWNANETKFSGAYLCIKCWVQEQLDAIGVGGEKFTQRVLHTDLGRFRVTPSPFPACTGVFTKDVCPPANQYQTPFIGVLLTAISFNAAPKAIPYVATTGSSAGAWTGGAPGQPIPQILWDAGTGPLEAPKR